MLKFEALPLHGVLPFLVNKVNLVNIAIGVVFGSLE